MTVTEATRDYERWLGRQLPLVRTDLDRKHRQMRKDPFAFFRATYYRWVQRSDDLLGHLSAAPAVLAVGDLHVENFGTWRDAEGRLVWGINDFDEAARLPYVHDLVRLATSAALARAVGRMRIRVVDICEAVLLGYRDGLKAGGRPFVLADQNRWLRDAATNDLRDPVRFWKRFARIRERARGVPRVVRARLEDFMPSPAEDYRIVRRVAGLGSLGRPRFLALGRWRGGWVAREARALASSAVQWARGERGQRPCYEALLESRFRTPDPFVSVRAGWLLRRLAPDCSRIELESLPKRYDEYRLMHAMGYETANLHLGTAHPMRIREHLRSLVRGWLLRCVETMATALREDWEGL
jgi:Uncharacterized protein conserved in bacteria (DUF2252)